MPGIQNLSASSWSPSNLQPVFSRNLKPDPQFYITREDGSYVPLIPADELPHDVHLRDVSLRMDASDVKNMTFAGHFPSTGRRFAHDKSFEVNRDSNGSLSAIRPFPQNPHNGQPHQKGEIVTVWPYGRYHHAQTAQISPPATQTSAPVIPAELQPLSPKPLYNVRPLPPSGVEPDPKKKVYCTYWIMHASCSYSQQGCLYKHEMPDLQTLKSIGIDKFPPWWQKQQARRREVNTHRRADSSSSEWEEVSRQQAEKSNLHIKDASSIRARVPLAGPATDNHTVSVPQEPRSAPLSTLKKNTSANTKTKSVNHSPGSPSGGVRLASDTLSKPNVSSVPAKLSQKPSLDSPIEDDLIGFDVLEPLSSSDTSTPTQSSYESLPQQASKHETSSGKRRGVVAKKTASTATSKRRTAGKENEKGSVWRAISNAEKVAKTRGTTKDFASGAGDKKLPSKPSSI